MISSEQILDHSRQLTSAVKTAIDQKKGLEGKVKIIPQEDNPRSVFVWFLVGPYKFEYIVAQDERTKDKIDIIFPTGISHNIMREYKGPIIRKDSNTAHSLYDTVKSVLDERYGPVRKNQGEYVYRKLIEEKP